MYISKALAHIDSLHNIFIPADVPINHGAFLSGEVDCISILDEIAATEAMDPESANKSTPHDGANGLMLDFADTLIHDDLAFMPYAAIVAAYVSMRAPAHIYGARIDRLMGQIDDRFRQASTKAQTPQALEKSMRAEFETYYCAGRIIPFEGCSISRKIHGRLNQMLRDFAREESDQLYFECIASGTNSTVASPHNGKGRFPAGESILWMNFTSAMQRLNEIANEKGTTFRHRCANLEKINRISGNVALHIPEASLLNDVAVNFFSDSLDALLEAKPRIAAGIITTAHAKIREMGRDVNPAFVSTAVRLTDGMISR